MITAYRDYFVQITNESEYDLNSNDNDHFYDKVYHVDINSQFRPHKHGIKVSKHSKEIVSAIICALGGGTTIHEKSFIIKNDALFICCANAVYSLSLPDLNLNWAEQIDDATCFGIYEFQDNLLIHGEMEIVLTNNQGNKQWTFGARDIFVRADGGKSLEIVNNNIHVWDWGGYHYILNDKGEAIN